MKPTLDLSCFKNNDVRGIIGCQINEPFAYLLGKAFGQHLLNQRVEHSLEVTYQQRNHDGKKQFSNSVVQVVVGRDNRDTSLSLQNAMTRGLIESGITVVNLGVTGTEEVYFASRHLNAIGGVQITASHNPINYNGMKLVGADASPISKHSGLNAIKRRVEALGKTCNSNNTDGNTPNYRLQANQAPQHYTSSKSISVLDPYVDHLLSYINPFELTPIKIVVNAGNGVAGHVIDALESRFINLGVPIKLIKINHKPDAKFPNGIPNPLIIENQNATREAVLKHAADIGIAWDGDFDRCFFFDETGRYIEGYYIVGLLIEAFLLKEPNATVLHDMRLTWNTIEVANKLDGNAIAVKAGHALIKEAMRNKNAVYGGEMSAHHYFRDFGYCDSGMIPWLLIIELISKSGRSLYQLTQVSISNFPSSGEINRTVSDPKQVIENVLNHYKNSALTISDIDGISIEMSNWRFNLRMSNTEPLMRLNVESRKDPKLLAEKVDELLSFLV